MVLIHSVFSLNLPILVDWEDVFQENSINDYRLSVFVFQNPIWMKVDYIKWNW